MISFSLLVLVGIVMIVGGILLLPESLLAGLVGRTKGFARTPGQIDDPEGLVEIAEAYESNESFREALKYWTRYVEITDDSEGKFRRGLVLRQLNKPDRAIGDFLEIEQNYSSLPSDYYLHRARSWRDLDETRTALKDYESHFERNPDAFDHWLEGARYAARVDRTDRAKRWFETIIDGAETPVSTTAELELAEFLVNNDQFESARGIVEAINEAELNDDQAKTLLFVKARIREESGDTQQAHELYQTLYDRDSDFRNVEAKIKEHQATISDENLLHDFKILNKSEFAECSRNIVRIMGYEPMETREINEEEINVTARDKASGLMKMDRYLFAFKQWDSYVGVLALKEFEMTLLEGRYDEGFFAVPRGFKPSAIKYAKKSPKLTLIGPDKLVRHLREIL